MLCWYPTSILLSSKPKFVWHKCTSISQCCNNTISERVFISYMRSRLVIILLFSLVYTLGSVKRPTYTVTLRKPIRMVSNFLMKRTICQPSAVWRDIYCDRQAGDNIDQVLMQNLEFYIAAVQQRWMTRTQRRCSLTTSKSITRRINAGSLFLSRQILFPK